MAPKRGSWKRAIAAQKRSKAGEPAMQLKDWQEEHDERLKKRSGKGARVTKNSVDKSKQKQKQVDTPPKSAQRISLPAPLRSSMRQAGFSSPDTSKPKRSVTFSRSVDFSDGNTYPVTPLPSSQFLDARRQFKNGSIFDHYEPTEDGVDDDEEDLEGYHEESDGMSGIAFDATEEVPINQASSTDPDDVNRRDGRRESSPTRSVSSMSRQYGEVLQAIERNSIVDKKRPQTIEEIKLAVRALKKELRQFCQDSFSFQITEDQKSCFSLSTLAETAPSLMRYTNFLCDASKYGWEKLFTDETQRPHLAFALIGKVIESHILDHTFFGGNIPTINTVHETDCRLLNADAFERVRARTEILKDWELGVYGNSRASLAGSTLETTKQIARATHEHLLLPLLTLVLEPGSSEISLGFQLACDTSLPRLHHILSDAAKLNHAIRLSNLGRRKEETIIFMWRTIPKFVDWNSNEQSCKNKEEMDQTEEDGHKMIVSMSLFPALYAYQSCYQEQSEEERRKRTIRPGDGERRRRQALGDVTEDHPHEDRPTSGHSEGTGSLQDTDQENQTPPRDVSEVSTEHLSPWAHDANDQPSRASPRSRSESDKENRSSPRLRRSPAPSPSLDTSRVNLSARSQGHMVAGSVASDADNESSPTKQQPRSVAGSRSGLVSTFATSNAVFGSPSERSVGDMPSLGSTPNTNDLNSRRPPVTPPHRKISPVRLSEIRDPRARGSGLENVSGSKLTTHIEGTDGNASNGRTFPSSPPVPINPDLLHPTNGQPPPPPPPWRAARNEQKPPKHPVVKGVLETCVSRAAVCLVWSPPPTASRQTPGPFNPHLSPPPKTQLRDRVTNSVSRIASTVLSTFSNVRITKPRLPFARRSISPTHTRILDPSNPFTHHGTLSTAVQTDIRKRRLLASRRARLPSALLKTLTNISSLSSLYPHNLFSLPTYPLHATALISLLAGGALAIPIAKQIIRLLHQRRLSATTTAAFLKTFLKEYPGNVKRMGEISDEWYVMGAERGKWLLSGARKWIAEAERDLVGAGERVKGAFRGVVPAEAVG